MIQIPYSKRTAELLGTPVWMLTRPLIVQATMTWLLKPSVRSLFFELDVHYGFADLLRHPVVPWQPLKPLAEMLEAL